MTLRDDRNRATRLHVWGGFVGGVVSVIVWRLLDAIAFLIASAWWAD